MVEDAVDGYFDGIIWIEVITLLLGICGICLVSIVGHGQRAVRGELRIYCGVVEFGPGCCISARSSSSADDAGALGAYMA